MKQVVIEGTLSMVSYGGIGVKGTEVGSGEEWKIRLGNRGNIAFQDVPLGAKVRVEITTLEDVE